MPRAIVAAAIERSAGRAGPFQVAGPDEDGFTLVTAALERLLAQRDPEEPFERVAVIGPFPAEMTSFLGEAIGRPGLEVRRSEGGEAPLYAALAAAAGSGSKALDAVVAVDVGIIDGPNATPTVHGAGAIAFAIAEGTGFEVHGHGERNHPPSRAPDARAWVRSVRRAAGPDPATGTLLIRAPNPPPVLLAFWKRELPGMEVATSPPIDPTIGPAPHLVPAMDVLGAASSAGAGPRRVLAHIEPDRTTFAGFVSTGRVEVSESSPRASEGISPETLPGGVDVPSLGLSEGAYLSKPRYLEQIPSRWRFLAERCPACGHRTFPARGRCRHCGRSEGLEPESLPTDGRTVEARTTVRPGAQPTEFDDLVAVRGGYDVVLVQLAPDARATLQATDAPPGSILAGSTVDTRLRRLYRADGEWRYGRKAVPSAGREVPPRSVAVANPAD